MENCGMDFYLYTPENFYNKNCNEKFIQYIMSRTLLKNDWRNGDPNKFEPDYFCDGVPYEFTLASAGENGGTYVRKIKNATYASNDVEKDAMNYIWKSVEKKARKNYAVEHINLCVLCLLNLYGWMSDEYGSVLVTADDLRREKFLDNLKTQYIKSKRFDNIFIIILGLAAEWWVFDVQKGAKSYVQLSDKEIFEGKMPYTTIKTDYNKYVFKNFMENQCDNNLTQNRN